MEKEQEQKKNTFDRSTHNHLGDHPRRAPDSPV